VSGPTDAILSIADVHPVDDFDGEGYRNIREFLSESDPTDPWSLPKASNFILDFYTKKKYIYT